VSSSFFQRAVLVPARGRVGGRSLGREWAGAFGLALALTLGLRLFVIQAFQIPSGSMLPTLQVGDYVLVGKFLYGLRIPLAGGWVLRYADPRPGDVIVFTHQESGQDFVKRVIAVGGEVVEVHDKQVLVNGVPRDFPEAYFADGREGLGRGVRDRYGPIRVPAGHLFMMGDNRDRSYDSRFWGFVDIDDVKGKALLVYWSWDDRDSWVRWERLGKGIH
jgi:signal peptidase I